MKRRIAVIVRPPSDGSRLGALRSAVSSLRQSGYSISVRLTFDAGDGRRFARAAGLAGWDVVVAAGGDGTVNEVVNGIAALEKRPLLAVVPLGTGNDFASAFDLPRRAEAALRVAAEGEPVEVDIAEVNRRCFINVSTGGFGAAVTRAASADSKRRFGRLAYVVSGAKRLFDFHPVHGRFRADGKIIHNGEFVFFAVGNAQRTGGGTKITPRADVGDGKLDIAFVRGISRLDFLALLPDLRAGTHLESPDVEYLRAHTFEVESRESIGVNADGEPVAGQRFRYRLLPKPVSVLVPA